MWGSYTKKNKKSTAVKNWRNRALLIDPRKTKLTIIKTETQNLIDVDVAENTETLDVSYMASVCKPKAAESQSSIQRLLSLKTGSFLLLLVVGLEIAALLAYLPLDSIIHGDLYKYGLNFSLAWATDYWKSNLIVIGTLIGSIMLTGFSMVLLQIYSEEGGFRLWGASNLRVSSRWACVLCPSIAAGLAAVSLYFVWHIDSIVHVTLYQYGLQFSEEWAVGYWTVARATLGLGEAAIAVLVSIAFVTWVVTRNLAEERFFLKHVKML